MKALLRKKFFLRFTALAIGISWPLKASAAGKTIDVIETIPKKLMPGSTDPTQQYSTYPLQYDEKVHTVESDVFQKGVKAAIEELQETMSRTCANEMKVSLKIDGVGKWAIASVGIGGNLEIKILNPDMPKNCAK